MCVSVTFRYCIKTAKRRITQIMPHDRVFKAHGQRNGVLAFVNSFAILKEIIVIGACVHCGAWLCHVTIFNARGYAKRGICRRRVSVCLSVCVSVTLRYCIKTAKRRITQIMPTIGFSRRMGNETVYWHL